MKKIYYYDDFDSDVISSSKQNIEIKSGFKWLHKNIFYKVLSYLLYYVFIVVGFIYVKLFLRLKFVNKKSLKGEKNYYLFLNHTQKIGDAFIPALLCFPKRPYFIVNKANLGIPFLGKILPLLGAIVVPSNLHDFKYFKEALDYYGKNHPIIIYPEAHVWPYYTKIRDFKKGGFQLAIENQKNVYSATITYQKRKFSNKPKIILYVNGKHKIENNLSKKEKINKLSLDVYKTMCEKAKLSNDEYITYKKKDN